MWSGLEFYLYLSMYTGPVWQRQSTPGLLYVAPWRYHLSPKTCQMSKACPEHFDELSINLSKDQKSKCKENLQDRTYNLVHKSSLTQNSTSRKTTNLRFGSFSRILEPSINKTLPVPLCFRTLKGFLPKTLHPLLVSLSLSLLVLLLLIRFQYSSIPVFQYSILLLCLFVTKIKSIKESNKTVCAKLTLIWQDFEVA